jgi:peptide/nickel transport system permease protein
VRYLGLRLVQAILAILGASTIVFFVLHLSSDPVLLLAPQNATPADLARLRHQLRLDQPIWVQYVTFLQNLIHGNLGYSYVQDQPAIGLVLERLPYTAELAVAALVLSLSIGVPIGMLTAVYRGTWIEQALMPIILVGQSMPSFWSGILLILLFSVHFHWLPSSGTGGIRSLILPAITLASLTMATFARMTRSSFMEQLDQEYVRTARSKGVGAGRIMVAHVLRNASIPIITVLGLETANLLGGAVITETIFAWPGIGLLTVQAIAARDFPIIQAVVLLASVIFISANLLTDLLYGVVDPRIRLGGEAAT